MEGCYSRPRMHMARIRNAEKNIPKCMDEHGLYVFRCYWTRLQLLFKYEQISISQSYDNYKLYKL